MTVLSSAGPWTEVWFYILVFLLNRNNSLYQIIYTETLSVLEISASLHSWGKENQQNRVFFFCGNVTVMLQLLYRYFSRSCFVFNLILPVTRCSWNENVNLALSVATSVNRSCRIRSVFILEQTLFTLGVSYLIQVCLFMWPRKIGF